MLKFNCLGQMSEAVTVLTYKVNIGNAMELGWSDSIFFLC